MSKHRVFRLSAKAERGLGCKARPYAEALKQALARFRADGQLR